jgi:hypothetical protein
LERRKFITLGKKEEVKSPYIDPGAATKLLKRYSYKDAGEVKETVEHVFGKGKK